jgi:hypothetical protein
MQHCVYTNTICYQSSRVNDTGQCLLSGLNEEYHDFFLSKISVGTRTRRLRSLDAARKLLKRHTLCTRTFGHTQHPQAYTFRDIFFVSVTFYAFYAFYALGFKFRNFAKGMRDADTHNFLESLTVSESLVRDLLHLPSPCP